MQLSEGKEWGKGKFWAVLLCLKGKTNADVLNLELESSHVPPPPRRFGAFWGDEVIGKMGAKPGGK